MDQRSFGPLGDLIRTARLSKGYGLLDVAKACKCSVQFISNIEHGRAPLPWDKADLLAKTLEINPAELKAANLAIRSDFKSFFGAGKGPKRTGKAGMEDVKDAASILDMTSQDSQLREILQNFSSAPSAMKKKFYAAAKKALTT